ncbi:MAG: DUF4276 family protein [Saprospiraceae bacterium]
MIRAIYIIVEGETEEEFVNSLIQPYLYTRGIADVRAIKLSTSPGHKGGDLKFARYKRNVENLLKREQDILVTSLIDFYKLRTDFPDYNEAQAIRNVAERVAFLESACKEKIGNARFVPYIQLHEFEGLLFTDQRAFDILFPNLPPTQRNELIKIINEYPNPELIDEGTETAPSKRLQKLIPGYEKPLFGPMIALENGIESMLQKCPRFNEWIHLLITTACSSTS